MCLTSGLRDNEEGSMTLNTGNVAPGAMLRATASNHFLEEEDATLNLL